MKKILKSCISILLIIVFSLCYDIPVKKLNGFHVSAEGVSAFTNYITRDQNKPDKLYDGSNEFRFIGFDTPNLHYIEDSTARKLPTAYEIEDGFKAIVQMGGRATRILGFSVRGSIVPDPLPAYILAPNTFDETCFRTMDKVLEMANLYGVRLIIAFESVYWGGIDALCDFRGKPHDQFFTDPQLIADYKDIINYILNRTNHYTGIQYKNDKAVLCWQLGNEFERCGVTDDWVKDMAAYVKGIDPNHLVMDCRDRNFSGILDDPNVDICGGHYYDPEDDFYLFASIDRGLTMNKKAFIIDEYGFKPAAGMDALMDQVIGTGISGCLAWSLRFHDKEGGSYIHGEINPNYMAYRWPGFPSGDFYDETNLLNATRSRAYQITGLPVPSLDAPQAPYLLPIKDPTQIAWQGSTGGKTYDVERATSVDGPFSIVANRIPDDGRAFYYSDTTAQPGIDYFYRVKAYNPDGLASGYSNIRATGTLSATGHIANAGFESGSTGWILGSTFSLTTEDKHTGSNSIKLTGTGGWTYTRQDIAVSPNTDYTLKFYAKSTGTELVYKVLDTLNNAISSTYNVTNTNNWVEYTLSFNSGSNSSVRIYLGDGGTEICYMDDFVLLNGLPAPAPTPVPITYPTPTPVPAGANLLYNPGFEKDYHGWTGVGTDWSIVTTEVYDGFKAIKLDGTGDWCCVQQKVPVSQNTDYKLSFYANCSSSGLLYKVLSDAQTPVAIAQANVTGNNQWTLYTLTFNSGSSKAVSVYLGDGGTGTYYLDDFSLSREYVQNAGFESGVNYPWTTNPQFLVTNAEKNSGVYSLKLTTAGNAYNSLYQPVAVNPNTNYILKFYVKSNDVNCMVKTTTDQSTPVEIARWMQSTAGADNTWKQQTITFNSGSNYSIRIYLLENAGEAGKIHYFDDFLLAPQ